VEDLLRYGQITDTGLSRIDLRRLSWIYNKDIGHMRGTTTSQEPAPQHPELKRYVEITLATIYLSADLMFVNKISFLLSVSSDLKYVMVSYLPKKDKKTVLKRIQLHIDRYKTRGFIITQLFADGEGSIAAFAPELREMGIQFSPHTSGQHANAAETMVRRTKEKVRIHRASTPFMLTRTLLIYLVCYCGHGMNFRISSTSNSKESVFARFTGRHISGKFDIFPFGQYCEATAPNQSNNALIDRTDGVLLLLSNGTHLVYVGR